MVVNATRVSSVVHLERRQGTQHQPPGSRRGRRNDQRPATRSIARRTTGLWTVTRRMAETVDCNTPEHRSIVAQDIGALAYRRCSRSAKACWVLFVS
ncbi:hypothetical protein PoB_006862900 [Plakobranchus ocellatus]|uniref:Uncharacterized protein n=1 Tax=Plakobranchus ocellatus TaxID=259542 RepID=A0AAV4DD64_9GAST|nr:hypothetical protein PoB_006862900 [Plakobranchus ocellatus]